MGVLLSNKNYHFVGIPTKKNIKGELFRITIIFHVRLTRIGTPAGILAFV